PTGLVRWKPIEGATRYQVLYPDVQPNPATFETTTNVGDLREFFTLHEQFGWGKTIHWRVRAIRYIDDSDLLKNGLPRATYGPWSTVFSTVIPPRSAGFLSPLNSLSDTWDSLGNATTPHDLTPGFSWNPSDPYVTSIANFGSSLYRV